MVEFALVVFACVLIYHYLLKYKYNYWEKNGVKGPTPLPIVGNFGKLMVMLESLSELARKTYEQYPRENIVGLYCGFRKVVVLRDVDIIKQVLTKDFRYFMSRGLKTTDRGFANNLLTSEGETWLALRKILTPAFTSTKLKQMTPLIQECVDKLIAETENQMDGNPCDVRDLCEKYSLDTTCSCVFGLSLDIYSNEIKHFREVSKQVSKPSFVFWFWYVVEMIIPGIQCKITKINLGSYLRSFFMKLVTTVISERKSRGIKRNDFINIMIDLKAQDKLKIGRHSPLEITIDDNFIASQAFTLYVAGQETSSSVLAFLLYELSLHEEMQDVAYKEICQVFQKFNEDSYDSVKEMNYLNMVYLETLRKHPAIGFLMRQATTDYLIPETKIVMKANTLALISIVGLHNDPKYFKDPEKFNPDNFSEQNMSKIPQYVYMPFGDGPRNCIGLRFAKMQVLMAAATFLRKYRLSPCRIPIRYSNSHTIVTTIGGIWINLTKR